MTNIKILVCNHKKDVCATKEPYYPIHVGKKNATVDLGIQGDDTGDNISEKNQNYAELTGMYWAWKNLKDVDVIGLCHYRRYFDFYGKCRRFMPYDIISTKDFESVNLDIPQEIIDSVNKGKVVVAKPIYYLSSLANDYCCHHISEDLRTIQKVFLASQSDKFIKAFDKVMYHNNGLMHYNMFIMKWDEFDKYCNWLFGLLGEMEKLSDTSNYSPKQKRVYGFMAERLMNVYLKASELPLIYKPVIKVLDESKISRLFFIRNRIRGTIASKLAYINQWW